MGLQNLVKNASSHFGTESKRAPRGTQAAKGCENIKRLREIRTLENNFRKSDDERGLGVRP